MNRKTFWSSRYKTTVTYIFCAKNQTKITNLSIIICNFTKIKCLRRTKNMFEETKHSIKAIGGPAHFFTKINFGFYLKALSANYKLDFIEFKNII